MAEKTVTGRCPRCGKAIQWAAGAEGGPLASGPLATGNLHRPFCSERCKIIDLGNRRWPFGQWIDEEYRIPGENPSTNEKEGGRGGGK